MWLSRTFRCGNLVRKPDSGFVADLFLSVDLLLVERPLWKLARERPQGNLGWNVNELDVTGLRLPCGSGVGIH